MAVAGATIAASCFSTAATSNGSTPPKQSDFVLRMACMRTPPSISHSHSLPITPICRKWGKTKLDFKVFAAVEQDEVLSSVVESESTVETVVEQEIEKEEEEVISSSEVGEEATEEKEEEAPVPAVNTKLYFGNLPYNCDSAQLAGIIQEYGSPELVEVLYDRITGRSRGFAFVTMSSIEDANSVINNLDGSEYAGRRLKVNFSDKPKPKQPIYPETEYKLFVGNLSWSVTSEMLLQAFQQYGNVVGARVLFDGDTGRSRGYGFVSYSSKEDMEAALGSLNGMELDGREMRVSLAQGKRF